MTSPCYLIPFGSGGLVVSAAPTLKVSVKVDPVRRESSTRLGTFCQLCAVIAEINFISILFYSVFNTRLLEEPVDRVSRPSCRFGFLVWFLSDGTPVWDPVSI